MSRLDIINSTIIFFVCKNTIVVCLLVYRLIVVGLTMNEEDDDDSDDGMDFFYKDRHVTPNFNATGGNRWAEKSVRPVPTISGRSVVTDGTSATQI